MSRAASFSDSAQPLVTYTDWELRYAPDGDGRRKDIPPSERPKIFKSWAEDLLEKQYLLTREQAKDNVKLLREDNRSYKLVDAHQTLVQRI